MAFLVTCSDSPVVFDALPAIKVRHYTGCAPEEKIYAYAKLYLHKQSLALSLSAFEREPSPDSRVAFAIGGPFPLFIEASSAGCHLYCGKQEVEASGEYFPSPSPFAGQDEQGWYWGISLLLPPAFLALSGQAFQPGGSFSGAVFKYTAGMPGFGASHPIQNPLSMLEYDSFCQFTVVPY